MTREEAAKGLQNIIEYWTLNPHEQECARVAIEALREPSRERWVDTGLRYDDGRIEYVCSNCGAHEEHLPEFGIPYCWNCGAIRDWEE